MRNLSDLQISSKEHIRSALRDALNRKATDKNPNFNHNHCELCAIANPVEEFVTKVSAAKWEVILCRSRKDLAEQLVNCVTSSKGKNIFSNSVELSMILSECKIRFQTQVDQDQEIDLAILYSDVLVARNGGVVFTKAYCDAYDVNNLAKHIAVVALGSNIVDDCKDAISFIENKYGSEALHLVEMIAPKEQQNNATENETLPNFTLFMMINN